MQNNLVSILIPTYNRADFLDYSLEIHIPMIAKYNIQIMVFDNASTDNTREVVNKWKKKYPYLIYHKHEENIGAIGNFEYALQYPSTEFVWLLGDTYNITNKKVVDEVLNKIKNSKNLDAVILNLENKIKLCSSIYNDSNKLLSDLGALATCISVSIFKTDMVNKEILMRYKDVWFTHIAIILEYISNRNFNIHWIQEHSITPLTHTTLLKTNWSHTPKAFEIGCEDWINFVMSLPPSYRLENKMKCIMDFGKVSGLFTLQNLIILRVYGLLNTEVTNNYKKFFPFIIDYPLILIYIIAFIPRVVFKILVILVIIFFKKDKIKKISEIWKK